MSVEGLPTSLKSLHANDCVSLERVVLQDSDSIRELMFRNCLRLDIEARRVIINRTFAKYVCLPGKEVPPEFTYKAAADSITISPGKFSSTSSRFKACVLLSPIMDNALIHVNCYLRSKKGVLINQANYLTMKSDQSPQVRTQHFFILGGDLLRQQNHRPEVDVNTSEILFEFTCSDNHKIIECGVRILNEEVKKKHITELPCFNTGDNKNDHTDDHDKNDDGGDCEPEAGDVSQVENVESNKHTGRWSFLRKLGILKKKKKTETPP